MKKLSTNLFTRINTNKSKGFTLIEVLVAIFVLEIGLLGIAGFYASSLKITKMARNETIASNLASGLLDEELAIYYDNLEVSSPEPGPYSDDPNNPFHHWNKQIVISLIDANLRDVNQGGTCTVELPCNMKQITVTIFWNENGQDKSFKTASIKAKH